MNRNALDAISWKSAVFEVSSRRLKRAGKAGIFKTLQGAIGAWWGKKGKGFR